MSTCIKTKDLFYLYNPLTSSRLHGVVQIRTALNTLIRQWQPDMYVWPFLLLFLSTDKRRVNPWRNDIPSNDDFLLRPSSRPPCPFSPPFSYFFSSPWKPRVADNGIELSLHPALYPSRGGNLSILVQSSVESMSWSGFWLVVHSRAANQEPGQLLDH